MTRTVRIAFFVASSACVTGLFGCAALPTRYADANPPARFDTESTWVLAPAYLDPSQGENGGEWQFIREQPTARDPYGFVAQAVAAELRGAFGSRPRSLYDLNIAPADLDGCDAAKLCALLHDRGVKYLAVVAAFSRESFLVGSSKGEVRMRVEVWDVDLKKLSFAAYDSAHRETPLLWVYHYWDTVGDVTPIGRDDIRAAAERLGAAYDESRAAKQDPDHVQVAAGRVD